MGRDVLIIGGNDPKYQEGISVFKQLMYVDGPDHNIKDTFYYRLAHQLAERDIPLVVSNPPKYGKTNFLQMLETQLRTQLISSTMIPTYTIRQPKSLFDLEKERKDRKKQAARKKHELTCRKNRSKRKKKR